MNNLLKLIFVVVVAAVIGKVVIEKQYESQLDDAIALTRGFVDLSYDDIKIGFDGSISINGLSITPAGLDDSVYVQSITATSSDRMFPIKGLDIFKDRKFPETFEVSVNRLSFPLSLAEQSQKIYFKNRPQGGECRSLMASLNYADAGYSKIDTDIRFAFDFSDVYNAVVQVDQFDQATSLSVEWIFDANQIEDIITKQTSELPVSELNVTFELEADAAERFVDQCSREFKVTPDVYLEKVVGSIKYSQNSFGADLGPDMRAGLVKFMRGGSRFELTSKPSSQLKKLEQLQFYKPQDVLRWMNLTVALDGEKLPLTSLPIAADDSADSDEKESSEQNGRVNNSKSKYSIVSISSASDYIGSWVRIKRTGGRKSLEGKLSGIDDDDDRLMVDMYQFGGLMTLTVGSDEIERIEVLNK